jgi:hypothetical protein
MPATLPPNQSKPIGGMKTPFIFSVPMAFPGDFSGNAEVAESVDFIGRGSRIRTCDLEYPKLPRYQTALYPALVGGIQPIWRRGGSLASRYTLPLAPAMRRAAAASAAQNR